MTESVPAADSRAIPSVILELFLTLGQPQFGSVADGHHRVRFGRAKHPLFVRQTGYLVAYLVSTKSHHRPAGETKEQKNVVE